MTSNRTMFLSIQDIHEVYWEESHRGVPHGPYHPEVDLEYASRYG